MKWLGLFRTMPPPGIDNRSGAEFSAPGSSPRPLARGTESLAAPSEMDEEAMDAIDSRG